MYYRDPSAEDKGIMDGVIDLNTVTAVTSVQGVRNYGFQTVVRLFLITYIFSARLPASHKIISLLIKQSYKMSYVLFKSL